MLKQFTTENGGHLTSIPTPREFNTTPFSSVLSTGIYCSIIIIITTMWWNSVCVAGTTALTILQVTSPSAVLCWSWKASWSGKTPVVTWPKYLIPDPGCHKRLNTVDVNTFTLHTHNVDNTFFVFLIICCLEAWESMYQDHDSSHVMYVIYNITVCFLI